MPVSLNMTTMCEKATCFKQCSRHADSTLCELHSAKRLVFGQLSDNHSQLGSGRQRGHLAGTRRQRGRQDFQERQAAHERAVSGLLQRGKPEVVEDWTLRFQLQFLFPKGK